MHNDVRLVFLIDCPLSLGWLKLLLESCGIAPHRDI